MHILITRPEPDASVWRTHLEARGVATTLDPLLTIEHVFPAELDLTGVQAVIATSRNGLRGLAFSPLKSQVSALPLFAVGPGTAELARDLEFRQVHMGPAAARELVGVITAIAKPGAGRLLHLSGDKIAFDLAAALAPAGHTVDRCIVYRSQPAEALKAETLAALASGAIDTVMLMSPLTAKTFVALVADAGLRQQCQRLVYVCLSHAVAAGLTSLNPVHVHAAGAPNSADMLALIEKCAAKPI